MKKGYFVLVLFLLVFFSSYVQAPTESVGLYPICSCVCNGQQQVQEYDAIKSLMLAGGVYLDSRITSSGTDSVANFRASNAYFALEGDTHWTELGPDITIVHVRSLVMLSDSICGTSDASGCSKAVAGKCVDDCNFVGTVSTVCRDLQLWEHCECLNPDLHCSQTYADTCGRMVCIGTSSKCCTSDNQACSSNSQCCSGLCNVNCCSSSSCPSDGWYCNGNSKEYRDYFCGGSSGGCIFSASSKTNCASKNGCSGDSNLTYSCSSGSCISSSDSCSDCSCSCGGYSVAEKPSNSNCADSKDNNCNGESDYDSSDGRHGDSGCPVSVSSISVSSSSPRAGSTITVDCGSSVAGINSISASVSGVGNCVWQGWFGSVSRFSCNVGSAGSKTVKCFVDTSKSYKSGTDRTTTITVPQITFFQCSSLLSSSSCEADSRCDWCPDCVGVKYTGGVSRCVDANTCPAAFCWSGKCGASCDSTNGGCSSSSVCNAATCSCACANDCSVGSRQCSGLSAYQTCGDYDSDPCLDWSSAVSCPVGESCNGGSCCADECSPVNLRQCSGVDSYQSCGNFDSDSCLEWGSPAACTPGSSCSNGECVVCDLDGTCDPSESCSCVDCLGRQGSCYLGQVCSFFGTCIVIDCNNDNICDSSESCSCVDCFGKQSTCPSGQVCSLGACITVDCDLDGICDPSESCSCSDCFGRQSACPPGQVCSSSGACISVSCNSDGVCDTFEPCSCADCFGRQGSCPSGQVCSGTGDCIACGAGRLPCSGGFCSLRCGICGNGIIDQNSGELCDPGLGSSVFGFVSTCSGLGFSRGSLACTSDCHFDTNGCVGSSGVCGNGILDVGEECDSLDWGSITGCLNLGFAGGVLDCASDCKFNARGCYDVSACNSNADCPAGAVCGPDGRCGCPSGTDLCDDGTCSSDCSVANFRGCLVEDGVCNPGEGCHCPDCTDGTRASCDFVSSCVGDFCSECTFTDAFWDATNCLGDACVVANGTSVSLVTLGSSGCAGRSFKFRVFWKSDSGKVVGYPSSSVFGADRSISNWVASWQDASTFLGIGSLLGAGSDDPVYEFYSRVVGISTVYSLNKLVVCGNDADCDGVLDGEDECANTPLGEAVSTEGSYKGCTASQSACVSTIDCSAVPWSDCGTIGRKTRSICKDSNGQPYFDESGSCCNDQATCMCNLGSCTGHGNWIPTFRECLVEQEFPFFTALNILVVVALLILFYFFVYRKKLGVKFRARRRRR